MTSVLHAAWAIIPTTPPQAVRHCPTCANTQGFAPSGRIRLNANGKKLDAWLIYKCTRCDQTWNRPLRERCPVNRISAAEREALEQNAPDLVKRHAFDAADLKRHCAQIRHASDITVIKRMQGALYHDWSEIRLRLTPDGPTGMRLDKILCAGWGVSRTQLHALVKAGSLAVPAKTKTALRRPLHTALTVRVWSPPLSAEMHAKLTTGLIPHDLEDP